MYNANGRAEGSPTTQEPCSPQPRRLADAPEQCLGDPIGYESCARGAERLLQSPVTLVHFGDSTTENITPAGMSNVEEEVACF